MNNKYIFLSICLCVSINIYSQITTKKWDIQGIEYPICDSSTIVTVNNNSVTWNKDSLIFVIAVFENDIFEGTKEIIEQMMMAQNLRKVQIKSAPPKDFASDDGFSCYYYKGTALYNNKLATFNVYGFYDPYEFKNLAAACISIKYECTEARNYEYFIEFSDNLLKTIKKIK